MNYGTTFVSQSARGLEQVASERREMSEGEEEGEECALYAEHHQVRPRIHSEFSNLRAGVAFPAYARVAIVQPKPRLPARTRRTGVSERGRGAGVGGEVGQ